MLETALAPTHKASGSASSRMADLTQDQLEVMQIILQAAEFFNLPKSVGEIYGWLFISEQPHHAESVQQALQLSKGGTSQGLKLLRDLGAVKVTYIPGDRRDYYTAETHLRNLVSGLILHRIEPALRSLDGRLAKLDATNGAQDKHFSNRVKQLKTWHSKAKKFMPLIRSMISG